jgi:small subunit ribosomal protein S4
VNIPSYLVREGDEISLKEKDLKSVQNALESVVRRGVPSWLEIDKDNIKGVVKLFPARDDITMPVKEQLVVEYYSR